jgi:hypothetical protein
MIARLLDKFTRWALSKNPAGGYPGEDSPVWAYTIETDGDPYLTRVLLTRALGIGRRLGFGVFLHHFHRPDQDRWPHNHPWKWGVSIILSGSYDETRLRGISVERETGQSFQVTTSKRVRWFNRLSGTDYHKVEHLHGDVWTLFITGPRVQDWGFLVEDRHVPWRDYLKKES